MATKELDEIIRDKVTHLAFKEDCIIRDKMYVMHNTTDGLSRIEYNTMEDMKFNIGKYVFFGVIWDLNVEEYIYKSVLKGLYVK